MPTSALTLRRRGDGIRVFEEEGNLKESGFGRKDFGDLEESRGVGCGEKLEMPFARRDAIVVVAMRRDVQGGEDCFFLLWLVCWENKIGKKDGFDILWVFFSVEINDFIFLGRELRIVLCPPRELFFFNLAF